MATTSIKTLEQVERAIYELEEKHPKQEWRPWCCGDQPLALEHWGLVQNRIELRQQTKRWTPERRKQAGEQARERHKRAKAADLGQVESQVRGSDGP